MRSGAGEKGVQKMTVVRGAPGDPKKIVERLARKNALLRRRMKGKRGGWWQKGEWMPWHARDSCECAEHGVWYEVTHAEVLLGVTAHRKKYHRGDGTRGELTSWTKVRERQTGEVYKWQCGECALGLVELGIDTQHGRTVATEHMRKEHAWGPKQWVGGGVYKALAEAKVARELNAARRWGEEIERSRHEFVWLRLPPAKPGKARSMYWVCKRCQRLRRGQNATLATY